MEHNLNKDKISKLVILLLLAAVLPITAALVGQRQEIRKEAAGSGVVKLTLDPSSGSKARGQAFTVINVKMTATQAKQIYAGEVKLQFQSTVFDISNVACGSNFPMKVQGTVSGNNINLICSREGGAAAFTFAANTPVILGSFRATVKNNAPLGASQISFVSAKIPEATTLIDLSDAGTTATYTITGGTTPTNTPGPTNTPIPSAGCQAVDRVINVTPIGGSGTCHDLQRAIDAVSGGQYTINLAAGDYVIPDSGDNFSIKILNKNDLTIRGDPQAGSKAVKLSFLGNRGGISVQGSSGSLEWMEIFGRTSNGIVYINESPRFSLRYTHISDETANAVQINKSADNNIVNSELKSSAVAIYLSNTYGATIANNFIHDSSQGVESNSSGAEILSNLFSANRDVAIYLIDPYGFSIARNTIVGTGGVDRAAVYLDFPNDNTKISLNKNIVASNSKGGVELRDANKGSYFFELNDVWNNGGKNYIGIADQTGKNGNISADPLFGAEYCLQAGSPAIYGDVSKSEYMGHRGSCGGPTPTGGAGEKTLIFKLKLRGVDSQPVIEANRTLNFRIWSNPPEPYAGGNQHPLAIGTVDQNGVWAIPVSGNFIMGYWNFYIKGPKHLQKKFTVLVGNESEQIVDRTTHYPSPDRYRLEPGDLPISATPLPSYPPGLLQDGVVNSLDAVYLTGCLATPDEATCLAKADLNLDGIISTMDIELLNGTVYSKWEDEVE